MPKTIKDLTDMKEEKMVIKTNNTGKAKKALDEAKKKAEAEAKHKKAFDNMEDSIKITHDSLKCMKNDSTMIINGYKVFFYKGVYFVLEPKDTSLFNWVSYDSYPKKRFNDLVSELAV